MKCRSARIFLATGSGCIAPLAFAQTPAVAAVSASGQMASLIISTAAVVALIVAASWLLKRLAPRRYSSNDTLRVVAGTAVGQRERVVVVEIGTTWLVLGVAPGHVNVLHHLPRAEPAEKPVEPPNKPRTFAQWLAPLIKKPQ